MWKRRCSIVMSAVLFVQPLAAAAPARTPLGAATPQALVARLTKAGETKNVAEIFACMDPQSRLEGTTALLMGATMMLAFMDMGAGMGGALAEGMAEAFADEGGVKPEEKAKLAKGKAEAAAKAAALKAKYSALLKKHGLPDLLDDKAAKPEGGPEQLLAKIDQPAFAADVLAFLEQLDDKKEGGPDKTPEIPRDVKDYAIDGDRATARAGSETVEFVRVDGSWFFKPPQKKHDAEQ